MGLFAYKNSLLGISGVKEFQVLSKIGLPFAFLKLSETHLEFLLF